MNIELSELRQLMIGNSAFQAPVATSHPSGQHIVVLDRGFIYVGEVEVDAQYCRISNARNIRVWGTTNGLGELRNGPLSGTKTDVVGEVIAPVKSVIHYIPCKGF
jgi:hypothetical protein